MGLEKVEVAVGDFVLVIEKGGSRGVVVGGDEVEHGVYGADDESVVCWVFCTCPLGSRSVASG